MSLWPHDALSEKSSLRDVRQPCSQPRTPQKDKIMSQDTYTTKPRTIHRNEIPAKLIDDLKKVKGLPPYNGFNPVMNDGYFWADIRRRYGSDMIAAAEALVIEPMQEEYRRMAETIANKYR